MTAVDAAARAGVKHVVFISAVGTRREEEPARGASYWRDVLAGALKFP